MPTPPISLPSDPTTVRRSSSSKHNNSKLRYNKSTDTRRVAPTKTLGTTKGTVRVMARTTTGNSRRSSSYTRVDMAMVTASNTRRYLSSRRDIAMAITEATRSRKRDRSMETC